VRRPVSTFRGNPSDVVGADFPAFVPDTSWNPVVDFHGFYAGATKTGGRINRFNPNVRENFRISPTDRLDAASMWHDYHYSSNREAYGDDEYILQLQDIATDGDTPVQTRVKALLAAMSFRGKRAFGWHFTETSVEDLPPLEPNIPRSLL
jgi:hypothetical protein